MTYAEVESDELLAPQVEIKDFKSALSDSHPTVSEADVQKQVDWTNEFGSEGA
jgi:vacuolar protein-sorting-associated protein 4